MEKNLIDYTEDIEYTPSTGGPDEATAKSAVNNLINQSAFSPIKAQIKDKKLGIGDKSINFGAAPFIEFKNYNGDNIMNHYQVFLLPNFYAIYQNQEPTAQNATKNHFKTIYPIIESSPYIYNITLQPVPIFDKGDVKFSVTWSEELNNYIVHVTVINTDKFVLQTINGDGVDGYVLFKKTVEDYDSQSTVLFDNDAKDYQTNINLGFIENNISKFHKHPYRRNYLKSTTGTELVILPQLLTGGAYVKFSYTWAVDSNHIIYTIGDTELTGYYNQNYKYGLSSQEVNNYSFLQTNEAYNQYIATSKQALQQQAKFNKENLERAKSRNTTAQIGNAGGAILGAIGSVATGNFGGFVSSIFGGIMGGVKQEQGYAQEKANIEQNIANQKAMLQDLKNTPNNLMGNADDLNGLLTKSSLTPLYIVEELWPALKRQVGMYFQIYGYNLNKYYDNPNKYLNTKYHFNFFQADQIFACFKESVPLTDVSRQIIEKSVQNGIVIWHYRDKNTFRGIRNFNVNNVDLDKAKNEKV